MSERIQRHSADQNQPLNNAETLICHLYYSDEIGELRRRENEMGIEPDWEIAAFMKASVQHGKRHNIRTDYTLRLLGLEVRIY